jgi:predicted dehydrogenase
MAHERLRLVMIGLGEAGRGMLQHLLAMPQVAVTALVEPHAGAMEAAAELCRQASASRSQPAPTRHADWAGLLSDSDAARHADAAVINTPGDRHVAPADAALRAGLHVLVAKPFAPSAREAAPLVALANGRGLTISVAQQMRLHRHVRALRAAIDEGLVGPVEVVHLHNAKPRPNPANLAADPHPVLREMACHHFDLLASLLPQTSRPTRVFVEAFRPTWSVYAGPCTIHGTIRYDGGERALYSAGFSARGAASYEVRVEGPRGCLRGRGSHMSVEDIRYDYARAGSGAWEPIDLAGRVPDVSPWTLLLDRWIDYVRGRGGEPPFSGRANLDLLALIDAAIASAQTGVPVALADPAPASSPDLASLTRTA